MKKWYLLGLLVVVLLWLAGAFIILPATEKALTTAATTALADPVHRMAFEAVKVKFSGKEAVLTGEVASQADRKAAEALITNDVRSGSGFNPVISVRNAIVVSDEYAMKHPKPWLMVMLTPSGASLSGVLPKAEDREAAEKALTMALGSAATKLTNQIKSAPELSSIRPALDLPATLASRDVADLATRAKSDARLQSAIAISACDGRWTLLPAETGIAEIATALGNAQPDLNLVSAAYAPLEALKVDLAEKERLALLPAPSLGFAITGQTIRITGTLADQAARDALLKAVAAKYPGLRPEDLTALSPTVKPGGDWTKALANAPKPGDLPVIFGLGSPDAKPVVWDGRATADAFAQVLASAGAAAVPSQPLFSALDLFNKQKADDTAAAAKAKADADSKAKAEADAKAKAMSAPTPSAAPPSAATRTPGYVGYALAGNAVRLFGIVGSEVQKTDLLKSAALAFPGLQLDSNGLRIDANRAAPGITFPSGLDLKTPTIGFLNASAAPTTFKADAFDSEIVKALPTAGFQESDLATALVGFRSELVKTGSLKLDDPFLSLASDGKTLTVVGEIADAAARQAFLDGLKASATGLTIDDSQFTVSPLVTKGGDLAITLKSLPKFEPGKPQIVSARPGQTARAGVVHGIYFGTGSDRSKDQERALFQVRRLLIINPAAKFEIVGHTDNVGKPEANTRLSQDRAQKFTDYLQAAGIPAAQLSTRGAGPNEPIADNSTDSGRALNRRVDVLLK